MEAQNNLNKKLITDFYMWMVEHEYDHNIRLRVEKKAEIFLKEHEQANEVSTSHETALHKHVVNGSACPKCGCQIYSPFGDGRLMHDVDSCGGVIKRKEGDVTIM